MADHHPVLPGLRLDPLTRRPTVIVGSRQGRPNLPAAGCPFCPGGLEAPEPYDVRWFPNRWPAMPDGRCEMVLYTPDHDAEFWTLGRAGARKVVDLWAERTAALGARDDVDYVLVFENRGPEVGATIPHPHGQIYAYPEVPPEPLRELLGRRARPRGAGRRAGGVRARRLAGLGAGGGVVALRAAHRPPVRRCPTWSTRPVTATVWPRCWWTAWPGWTSSSTPPCPT